MKLITITLIILAFLATFNSANANEIVTDHYIISFDGDDLKDSIFGVNVSEIIVGNASYESQTFGGTNYTEDTAFIGNVDNNEEHSGVIRVYVRNFQPNAASTIPLDIQCISETLLDSYWVNSTPRMIDGIKGQIIQLEGDNGNHYFIARYKLSETEWVEIDSDYPWTNGTLAFIRSLHIIKNKAIEV